MYTHSEQLLSASNILSKYLSDELIEWRALVEFYLSEIKLFAPKFSYVVHRNSIIGIAEKVESHHIRLNQVKEKINRILKEINLQESVLNPNNSLITDEQVTREIDKFQTDLRTKIQSVEKEYVDIKFDSYFFLSSVLKK
jgi:hypothetical protein